MEASSSMSGRPRRSSSKAASAKSSDRDDSSKEKQPTVPRLDFPFLLHRFLTEEAAITEKKPSVAGWSVAGDQFYIHYEDAALLSERMEPYFRHGNYTSLRRQLNVYGFTKDNNNQLWSRKETTSTAAADDGTSSTAFHRDHPENLDKIKPRRPKSGGGKAALARKRDAAAKQQPEKTTKKAPPEGALQALYCFLEVCSASHPSLIGWNSMGTAFFMEIYHPEVQALLKKYFPAMKKQPIQLLKAHGFSRDVDGNFYHESFTREKYANINPGAFGSPQSQGGAAASSSKPVPNESSNNKSSPSSGWSVSSDDDSLSDSSSTLYDHDLSTYATLKTDEMSFEQLESRADDENSFERLDDRNESDRQDEDSEDDQRPEPKFQPLQKCYARDKDGVMYAAVVRRRMYGPQYHRQVEMGLVTSKEEAAELMKEVHEPMWHYFVHYNKWNVNFDRWVPEECVFEMTDECKAFAERLLKEHRGLQAEMRKVGVKGKKQWQTIDGAAFLREWKKRMTKVERELKFGKYGDIKTDESQGDGNDSKPTELDADSHQKKESVAPSKKKTNDVWTKTLLATERKLREKSLTTKRPPSQVGAIVLPFALKKILVEQWEIISQCRMMPSLPAPVTVRQALNKYLESKNVPLDLPKDESTASAEGKEASAATPAASGDKPADTPLKTIAKDEETESREQEWRDMADGIAMLFDEALASRLLYREETPQLRALDNIAEYSIKPFSELYGCEHLLRLFVRLPDMLAGQLEEAEARPVIAKVNDFVRFLHKNHESLLTQSYRKLNEAELKEQQKILRAEERKRKSRQTMESGDSEEPATKKIRATESK